MTAQVETFITRWTKATGSELANAQLFISELCALLALEAPHPASDDVRDNAYVFERRVIFQHGDGTSSEGRIDCYRRGHFVLESKKIKGAPPPAKVLMIVCSAHAGRPKPTHAHYPPTKAGHRLWLWSMSAM